MSASRGRMVRSVIPDPGRHPPCTGEIGRRHVVDAAMSEEGRLHRRLLARDINSMAQIYDQFAPGVFAVALRVTTDRQAAEDVTQETLLDLWRRPERFDPVRGCLRPWLATIAHNRSIDWIRHERAARARDLGNLASLQEQVPDIGEGVDTVMTAERGSRRAVEAARARTHADPAGLLWRQELPTSGRSPPRSRGDDQGSHPLGSSTPLADHERRTPNLTYASIGRGSGLRQLHRRPRVPGGLSGVVRVRRPGSPPAATGSRFKDVLGVLRPVSPQAEASKWCSHHSVQDATSSPQPP